jgi:hypothetical protein
VKSFLAALLIVPLLLGSCKSTDPEDGPVELSFVW